MSTLRELARTFVGRSKKLEVVGVVEPGADESTIAQVELAAREIVEGPPVASPEAVESLPTSKVSQSRENPLPLPAPALPASSRKVRQPKPSPVPAASPSPPVEAASPEEAHPRRRRRG